MRLPDDVADSLYAVIEQLPFNELDPSMARTRAAALVVREAVGTDENSHLAEVICLLDSALRHADNAREALNVAENGLYRYISTGTARALSSLGGGGGLPENNIQMPVIPVTYRDPVPLYAGGVESKFVVTATVGGRERTFIKRLYDPYFIKSWAVFRQAGLPVPNARLTAESGGSLLVEDIKEDGSEVYGKGLCYVLEVNEPRERVRPEIDPIFMELTSEANMPAIEAEVERLLRIAGDQAISLPYDDPFELVVRPDGSWYIVTLDLCYARQSDQASVSHRHRKEIRAANAAYAQVFLRNLWHIRSYLGPDGHKARAAAFARRQAAMPYKSVASAISGRG